MKSSSRKSLTRHSATGKLAHTEARTGVMEQKHASGKDQNVSELTPRSMIKGLIDATQGEEQASGTKRAKMTPPPRPPPPRKTPASSPKRNPSMTVQSPRSRRRSVDLRKKATMKNFLQKETADKPTPRTMIAGFIDQGLEESMVATQPATDTTTERNVTFGGDISMPNFNQTSDITSVDDSYLSHYTQQSQKNQNVKRLSPKPAKFRNRKPTTTTLDSFTASLNKSLAKHRKIPNQSTFDLDGILEHTDDQEDTSKTKSPFSAARRSARRRRRRFGDDESDSEEETWTPRSSQQAPGSSHEVVLSVSKTQVVDVMIHSPKSNSPVAIESLWEQGLEESGAADVDGDDVVPDTQPDVTQVRDASSRSMGNPEATGHAEDSSSVTSLQPVVESSRRRSGHVSPLSDENVSPPPADVSRESIMRHSSVKDQSRHTSQSPDISPCAPEISNQSRRYSGQASHSVNSVSVSESLTSSRRESSFGGASQSIQPPASGTELPGLDYTVESVSGDSRKRTPRSRMSAAVSAAAAIGDVAELSSPRRSVGRGDSLLQEQKSPPERTPRSSMSADVSAVPKPSSPRMSISRRGSRGASLLQEQESPPERTPRSSMSADVSAVPEPSSPRMTISRRGSRSVSLLQEQESPQERTPRSRMSSVPEPRDAVEPSSPRISTSRRGSRSTSIPQEQGDTPENAPMRTPRSRMSTAASSVSVHAEELVSPRTTLGRRVSTIANSISEAHDELHKSAPPSEAGSARSSRTSNRRSGSSPIAASPVDESERQSLLTSGLTMVTPDVDVTTSGQKRRRVSALQMRQSTPETAEYPPNTPVSTRINSSVRSTLEGASPLVDESLPVEQLRTPNISIRGTPKITDFFGGKRTQKPSTQKQIRKPVPEKKPQRQTRKRNASERPRANVRMPSGIVREWVNQFCHLKVPKSTLNTIEDISDEFFKNAVEDLTAYTQHGHRQGITEDDVELLMKRQGFVTSQQSMHSLIEKYLPLEYREELIPCARCENSVQPPC